MRFKEHLVCHDQNVRLLPKNKQVVFLLYDAIDTFNCIDLTHNIVYIYDKVSTREPNNNFCLADSFFFCV